MKQRRSLLSSFLMMLSMAGCSTVKEGPHRTQVDSSRIELAASLENRIQIEGILARRFTDRLQAQVILKNIGNDAAHVQTRFMWFSSTGAPLDDSTAIWEGWVLKPGEDRTITGTAGSAKASDFRLSIQPHE